MGTALVYHNPCEGVLVPVHNTSTSDSNALMPIIRASEIGQYVFCHRAWWLGTVQGYQPVDDRLLAAGTQAHLQHGRGVARSLRWRQVGYLLLAIGIVLFIIFLCSAFGGNL
jgi:hypothetical protein